MMHRLKQLLFLGSFVPTILSAGCGPATNECKACFGTCYEFTACTNGGLIFCGCAVGFNCYCCIPKVTECGKREEKVTSNMLSPSIVNGNDATPHTWPWQVFLTDGSFLCGGTLIASDWVLTAAHCFKDNGVIDVYLGEHDRSITNCCRRKIQGTVTNHKDFDKTGSLENDIALVKLSTPVLLTKSINRACLPAQGNSPASVSEQVVITGWGSMTNPSGNVANILQEAYVNVADQTTCKDKTSPDILCLKGAALEQICPGDSGGPAVYKKDNSWTVVGISSFIYGNCDEGESFMTDVAAFRTWIDTKMTA